MNFGDAGVAASFFFSPLFMSFLDPHTVPPPPPLVHSGPATIRFYFFSRELIPLSCRLESPDSAFMYQALWTIY